MASPNPPSGNYPRSPNRSPGSSPTPPNSPSQTGKERVFHGHTVKRTHPYQRMDKMESTARTTVHGNVHGLTQPESRFDNELANLISDVMERRRDLFGNASMSVKTHHLNQEEHEQALQTHLQNNARSSDLNSLLANEARGRALGGASSVYKHDDNKAHIHGAHHIHTLATAGRTINREGYFQDESRQFKSAAQSMPEQHNRHSYASPKPSDYKGAKQVGFQLEPGTQGGSSQSLQAQIQELTSKIDEKKKNGETPHFGLESQLRRLQREALKEQKESQP